MRGARPEYGEPSARTVDATDIGSQHPARYGQNYLFAGSDAGGARAAAAYTLIETAKLNGLDPEAYLHEVLGRLADHPINRIAELLPWNIVRGGSLRVAA
jgi:hypothetical protein